MFDVAGRRFDPAGVPRGDEFPGQHRSQRRPAPPRTWCSDEVGNLVVAWDANRNGSSSYDIYARRYGGLLPATLPSRTAATACSKYPEAFTLVTSWRNVNGAAQTFAGRASGATAPAGLALHPLDPDAAYGTVADGATGPCADPCFAGSLSGTRPAGHVDAPLHRGASCPTRRASRKHGCCTWAAASRDVPRRSPFYRFIETLLHHGVTGGCSGAAYCPAGADHARADGGVRAGGEGGRRLRAAGLHARRCSATCPRPAPSAAGSRSWPAAAWSSGCGGGHFCPAGAGHARADGGVRAAHAGPDAEPAGLHDARSSTTCRRPAPFCRWIEELARRGITSGCGGGSYCPTDAVTREQMAVFLTTTFGLTLYGP